MNLVGFMTAKNDDWIIEITLKRLAESCDGIICIDDGSTDRTFEIMSSFDKVMKIIRNPPGGTWDVFRDAARVDEEVRKVRPQWLMYIDSDDLLDARFSTRRNAMLEVAEAGRYHFQEVTLWGGTENYRVDHPEWYARKAFRTPYLVRWSEKVKMMDPYGERWSSRVARWGANHWLPAKLRNLLPRVLFDKSNSRIMRFASSIIWPRDYLNYTNLRLSGYVGREIEVDLVKMHYHYADFYHAWRKHTNYALQAAIRQHRSVGEIPTIVDWASEKISDKGLVLAPVMPEWGALPLPS